MFFSAHAAFFPVGVLLSEGGIGIHLSFEIGDIEQEPDIGVGDDEVSDVFVVEADTFVEVIAQEFVEGFYIGFVGGRHFGFVAGSFGFDEYAHAVFGRAAVVDHEVLPFFGIDEVLVEVVGAFEEIGQDVFVVFFTFPGGMPCVFEQAQEFGFEPFYPATLHVLGAISG